MRSSLGLGLVLCLFVFTACGGGSSGGGGSTTVNATLKDADGSTVTATAGTTADPASFTVTFDQAMDVSSLTTAGNVTLVCGSLTPSITTTSVSSTEYTIAVADAYKYQLLECTLTLTANVKTGGGSAIAAQTFSFTVNACAVSDDFNNDTRSCWTVPSTTATWTSWDALLNGGIFAFDTASSELDYANTQAGSTQAAIFKTVTIDPQGFEITLTTNGLAGFNDDPIDGPTEMAVATLVDDASLNGESLFVGITRNVDGILYCVVLYSPAGGGTWSEMGENCMACASQSCQSRLTVSAMQISGTYSIGGGAFQQMATGQGQFPTNDTFADITVFKLVFLDYGADNRASIDAVTATGLTVSGQYE